MAIGSRKKNLDTGKGDNSEKGYDGTTLHSATVSSVDVSVNMMKQYVEGSNWTVDYYNQLKGEHDTITPLDPNKPDTLQQYQVIHNLELKLTTPLTQDKVENVNGSATILYNIKPQQFDLIHVSVADGKRVLLQVESVEQKLYNMLDVYDITFTFLAFQEINPNFFTTLENKTVKEFFFDKNGIADTSSPIVTGKVLEDKDWCVAMIDELSFYYLNTFKRYNGYLMLDKVYDPFITGLFLELVDSSLIGTENIRRRDNFWFQRDIIGTDLEAIMRRKIMSTKKPKILSLHLQKGTCSKHVPLSALNSMRYSGIDSIIDKGRGNDLDLFLNRDFYLISKDTKICTYELLYKFVNREALNIDNLKTCCNIRNKSVKEQYYEIPILILLLKDYVSSTYSNMDVHYG